MRKLKALSKLATAAVTIGGLFLPFTTATAKEAPVVVTAPLQEADLVVRRVSYADLDLALPVGRATLHERVGFAIGDVCAEANLFDNGSPEFKSGVMACSNRAWATRPRKWLGPISAPMKSRRPAGRPLPPQRSASASADRRRTRTWPLRRGHVRPVRYREPYFGLIEAPARLVRNVGDAVAGSSGQGCLG